MEMSTEEQFDSVTDGEVQPDDDDLVWCDELVNIPRKVYEQLITDTEFANETLEQIEKSSGAVVMLTDRGEKSSPQLSPFGQQQKSRREYLLRVSGSRKQVEAAKLVLMKIFRSNDAEERVNLKMDVSFCDHSFVIGRHGKGIQNVMKETKCHIHFPDSNRNQQLEKSNQVSITGPPEGVADARRQIRHLLPISFGFLVKEENYQKAMQLSGEYPDIHPKLKENHEQLQNDYNITIMVLPMEGLRTVFVTVRGRHANIGRIKQGISKLMNILQPGCPPVDVYLGIEVSPHHLDFVQGPNGCKVQQLMRETNTQFHIPQPSRHQTHQTYQIPTIRIIGQLDNVYRAWVSFMDLLPLALIVDIPAAAISGAPSVTIKDGEQSEGSTATSLIALNAQKIDEVAHELNDLLQEYHISLVPRQKSREVSQLLVIKGPEKNVDLMFEIYKALKTSDPVGYVVAHIRAQEKPRNFIETKTPPMSASMKDHSAYNSYSMSLSDSEALELYVLLLNCGMTNKLSKTQDPLGHYSLCKHVNTCALSSTPLPDAGMLAQSPFASPAHFAWRSESSFDEKYDKSVPLTSINREQKQNQFRLSEPISVETARLNESFNNSLSGYVGSLSTPKSSAVSSIRISRGDQPGISAASYVARQLFASENMNSTADDNFSTSSMRNALPHLEKVNTLGNCSFKNTDSGFGSMSAFHGTPKSSPISSNYCTSVGNPVNRSYPKFSRILSNDNQLNQSTPLTRQQMSSMRGFSSDYSASPICASNVDANLPFRSSLEQLYGFSATDNERSRYDPWSGLLKNFDITPGSVKKKN